MRFIRHLLILFLSAFFAQSGLLTAHHTHDWDNECVAEIYQVLKKFRDFEKKYEHKKKEAITKEDLVEMEKIWDDCWDELAQIIAQCHSAYEFNLMERVSELAQKDWREDVASLVDVSCKQAKESLREVTQE